MTNEEKQEIIAAVLAALNTNSKTIAQLTPVTEMSDDDYIELGGGRRVSYGKLIEGLITDANLAAALEPYITTANAETALSSKADAVNVAGAKKLSFGQAPMTALYNVDPIESCDSNDKMWLKTDGKLYYHKNGQDTLIGTPGYFVYYCGNKAYRWNGSAFTPLGSNAALNIAYDATAHAYMLILNEPDPISIPTLELSTESIGISGDTKTASFTLSGSGLTGDVTIQAANSNWKLSCGSMTNVSSLTLSPDEDGIISTKTITATYNGNESSGCAIYISGGGAPSKSVTISYAAPGTPVLYFLSDRIELTSESGTPVSGTIKLYGINLTEPVGIQGSAGFSVSPSSLTASQINQAGPSGVTITVTADTTEETGLISAVGEGGEITDGAEAAWTEAQSTPTDGLRYEIIDGGVQVVSNDPNASGGISPRASAQYDDETIVIPSETTINGITYPVLKIDNKAFMNCPNLKSVTIPASVTEVGKSAFYNTKLEECVIPDGVTLMGRLAGENANSAGVVFGETDIESLKIGNGIVTNSSKPYQSTGIKLVTVGSTSGNKNALKTLDLGTQFGYMQNQFINDRGVESLTLRYPGVVGVSYDMWDVILGWVADNDLMVYVPAAQLSAYRSESPLWSQISSRIATIMQEMNTISR